MRLNGEENDVDMDGIIVGISGNGRKERCRRRIRWRTCVGGIRRWDREWEHVVLYRDSTPHIPHIEICNRMDVLGRGGFKDSDFACYYPKEFVENSLRYVLSEVLDSGDFGGHDTAVGSMFSGFLGGGNESAG